MSVRDPRVATRAYQLTLRELHPWQKWVLAQGRRFNACTIGRRWGKSEGLGVYLLVDAALRGLPVGWFAPSYKILAEIFRATCGLLAPLTRHRDLQGHRLELVTGAVVEFWTLDSPDAGRSRKYGRVLVDEAAMVKQFKAVLHGALLPTLSDLGGDIWLLTTPRGFDEYYDVTIDFAARADGFTVQVPSTTNPYLEQAELDLLKSVMAPRYYAQEILASFESLAGRIVHQFDFFHNTIEAVTVPAHGDLLVGLDFNVNPMTAVVGFLREARERLEDGSTETYDELVIFDEIELHDSGTPEMCVELKTRFKDRVDDLIVYPDPTGGSRSSVAAKPTDTNFTLIKEAGLRVSTGKVPLLEDKFNEINALCCNARGRRRAKIARKCKRLIAAAQQYSYKNDTSQPDKGKWDHLVDAWGNIVHREFPIAASGSVVGEVYGR